VRSFVDFVELCERKVRAAGVPAERVGESYKNVAMPASEGRAPRSAALGIES
jgi:hypothetical protein